MERVVVFPCHAVKSELFRAAVLGQADASSSKDELHRSNIFEHPIGTIGKLENHKPCNRLFMLCSNKYAPGCDTVLPAYWGRRQGDRYCVCLPVQIHEKPSGTEISPLLARKSFLELVSGNFENMPFSIFCCRACLAGFGLQNVDPLLHWCFVGRQRRASLSFKDSFRKTKFRVPFWRAETKRAHQSESRRMFLALPWHVMTPRSAVGKLSVESINCLFCYTPEAWRGWQLLRTITTGQAVEREVCLRMSFVWLDSEIVLLFFPLNPLPRHWCSFVGVAHLLEAKSSP